MPSRPRTRLATRTRARLGRAPDFVQSLARGLEVIRAFDEDHPTLRLSAVAERTRLARAAVRRSLLTLRQLGYVGLRDTAVPPDASDPRPGLRYLSSLGLPELALPWMERLAQRVERVVLAQRAGRRRHRLRGPRARAPGDDDLPRRRRAAAGLCNLDGPRAAGGPVGRRPRAMAGRAPRARPHPAHRVRKARARGGDPARARAEATRWSSQELEPGLCSLAVPIRDRQGKVVAALNVGMQYQPGIRERALREILPALRETQRAIDGAAAHLRPSPEAEP